MKPADEKQILSNIVLFMRRSNLNGEEVIPFQEAMNYVGQRMQMLDNIDGLPKRPEAVLGEPDEQLKAG
jgi:hypothetical protein